MGTLTNQVFSLFVSFTMADVTTVLSEVACTELPVHDAAEVVVPEVTATPDDAADVAVPEIENAEPNAGDAADVSVPEVESVVQHNIAPVGVMYESKVVLSSKLMWNGQEYASIEAVAEAMRQAPYVLPAGMVPAKEENEIQESSEKVETADKPVKVRELKPRKAGCC